MQFIIDEAAYVQELRQGYFNKVISDINENNRYNLKFAITNKEIDLSLEDAYHQIIFADSIVMSDLGARASYFYRGIINGMVRNYYTAIQDYNMAISLDPSLVMAYLTRAMVSYEREEQNYFEQKYRSTVKISWGEHKSEPDNTTLVSPDFGSAILDLNKVIELNPGLAFAYYNRAHIKNRLKDYYGAIQDYTKAIERQDDFAEAYYNRGLTYIYLEDNRQACRDLSRAGELGLKKAYRVINKYCSK